MPLYGPKREFRRRVWTAVKAKARTARLAGAEWGDGGRRVSPAGVRGGAPSRQMQFLGSLSVVVVALVAVTVGAAVVGSGTQTARTDLLRTAWGDPDLQGVWTNATRTPLERPDEYGEQQLLSVNELKEQEEGAARNLANESAVRQGNPGTYNAFWRDPVRPTGQTSLIVDPIDGRIPALTLEAARRREAMAEIAEADIADGPEDRPFFERCLGRGWPRVGGTYQFTYQIFQNPDYVVLLAEMVNELHVIPLDGRPHGAIRQWMGDARGRWEDDTLVVETINFPERPNSLLAGIGGLNYPLSHLGGSAKNLRLVERFRRVNAETLDYRYTIDDATTFVQPWTVRMPMRPAEGMYEYACHEGNYGLMNILRGRRVQEGTDR